MKNLLFFSAILLIFACVNSPKQEISQAEINARAEAARKADSLLSSSKKMEEQKNLTQAFSGIHAHTMGSGNLAFDAHQDPEATRRLIRNYALLAERYRESAPKVEEARRKMIQEYQKAQEEEKRRIY
jgi:hypothetical protein